jgi:hypothetical protein
LLMTCISEHRSAREPPRKFDWISLRSLLYSVYYLPKEQVGLGYVIRGWELKMKKRRVSASRPSMPY